MAERVVVANTDDIGDEVADRVAGKSGIRSSRSTLTDLHGEVESLGEKMGEMEESLAGIEQRIDRLERRIVEVEEAKAQAKKEAKEEVYKTLEEKADEKSREYEKKLNKVLGDYKERISRLKERFINSISHRAQRFEEVTEEFESIHEDKEGVYDEVDNVGEAAASGHKRRLKSVAGARESFVESIDEFLKDREETADLIESLQTDIRRHSGAEKLQIPFWVVGIERNGNEELVVYPMQKAADTRRDEDISDESPYAEYLREHPEHSYGDMVSWVEEYVQKSSVRDKLASDEGEFGDPSILKSRGAANDRFIESLREFELSDRKSKTDNRKSSGRKATQKGGAD